MVKIYAENIRRYYQLKEMIEQAHRADQYLRVLNEGLNNATGLIGVLPIRDEKILGQIRDFQSALTKVEEIYGMIPKSRDEALQKLHDLTIAESLKLSNASKDYAEKQEKNAERVFIQSASASPKGAERMNAQTSAQILHSLGQLLRLNGQMLKLQSESFALTNKEEKDSSENFNKTKKDLGKAMNQLKPSYSFMRF
ncbi:MAG: hypothetical protein QE271_08125 [Bacteriovoracaceae bacterium]|nr:hypothetical protein [Bacteriovoracaceae bacterium]